MITACILGLGRWGQNLHQSVLKSSRIKITHACTRSPAKVIDYCNQHGLVLTDDYQTILNNRDIDAVIVVTPHSQHFEQIMQAAESGKHVFAEKPFTLSGDQASEALDTLAEKKRKVAIGHNRRFAPNTQLLKEMLEQKNLGEIIYVDGLFSAQMAGSKGQWRDSRTESPAGGMTSLGIHVVDMFINLCGEMSEVSANSVRLQTECDFDDTTVVNLNFRAGHPGVLTTLAASPMQWRVRIYGTEGWAELVEQDTLHVMLNGGEMETHHFDGFEYPVLKTMGDCLEDFADSVLEDKPFLIQPGEILHGTRVLEAIIRSAEGAGLISI